MQFVEGHLSLRLGPLRPGGGFPGGSAGKESTCNVGDLGSIPGLGRSPGEGKGYPLRLFLGFPGGSAGKEFACSGRDLGSIPGLGRSPGGGMATCSSILAWRIPQTEEPGGLQSVGLQRVGHDWATQLSAACLAGGPHLGPFPSSHLQIPQFSPHSWVPAVSMWIRLCWPPLQASTSFSHVPASIRAESRAWTEDFPSSRSCRGGSYTRLLWNLTTTPRHLGHSLLGKGCIISLVWEILPSCP